MLRRNLNPTSWRAHVLGGAVDPEDRHADLEPICQGRTDADTRAGWDRRRRPGVLGGRHPES